MRKNYATLHNILQLKKGKEGGPDQNRVGTGIKGYRKGEEGSSRPPTTLLINDHNFLPITCGYPTV